ncbi:small GTP-binding protein, putative [Trichomonas vaginalis G3]|uniref:Small GTP-binding protein, putative n=1 Tax=Trichomonas vaginalis (strain ATCC PRA-98 / G3) TaxID=412133 RepID=A2FHI9_TRIV3|nr:retrograde vesicle-mediated transport, Golgi to ER [Trichomonas vaginalis G3]EAX95624.1 small GTP-binding protein, putative [Trichomonas vaginalis G3]KAI5487443.1 retrograde vesicle-mediated transport, Golgi to ER [Trichomonas vaginalis G3]|eukprot:XP_001308554.1 small GTP-binding protein [Trichomonas vaginalis G3]
MKKEESVPEGKVIVVGSAGVGKTSLITMYTTQQFFENCSSTIAATYIQMRVATCLGEVALNLWDTAGQERFKSLIPMYSRNSAAAIVVTDLTNHDSLVQGEEWYNMVRENCPETCKIYLVANKCDLPPTYNESEFLDWAKSKSLPYFITSAKQHGTVDPLFQKIAEDLFKTPPPAAVDSKPVEKKSDHRCCLLI